MEITYQLIIVIQFVIIAVLAFRLNKKSYELALRKDEGNDFILKAGKKPQSDPEYDDSEKVEAKIEEDEDEKEYNFDDPDFNLSPIEPEKEIKGKVIGEHGDAIYGNEKRYFKELYYGRVSNGARLVLLDLRAYKNEFELDIIKVKVLTNEWKDEIGRICWVSLDDTSFRNNFNPKTRLIEL